MAHTVCTYQASQYRTQRLHQHCRATLFGSLICALLTLCQLNLSHASTHPQDPLFASQWALDNASGPDIGALAGWQYLAQHAQSGQPVVVGLIDTGIDIHHPDLRQAIWQNPGELTGVDANSNGIDDGCEDGSDADNNGYADDCHGINTRAPRWLDAAQTLANPAASDPQDIAAGHGTNMAALIAATANNADADFTGGMVGVAGLAPQVKIVTCAAADSVTDAFLMVPNLVALFARHDAILQCLDYFRDLADRGVNLVAVNASGGASSLVNLGDVLYAQLRAHYRLDTPSISQAIAALAARDITLVAATGNYGWDLDASPERAYYPAAFPHANIIRVAALDAAGELAGFSSFGRASADVLAPGRAILSAAPSQQDSEGRTVATYLTSDGTSQATAMVTGMVALLKVNAATAHLPPAAIRRLLMASGQALPALASKVRSASLVRLADANGRGALTCQDSLYQRPVSPLATQIHRLPGDSVHIAVERFRCADADAVPYLTVQVLQTGETLYLYDDGNGADQHAGDGIFSTAWTVPAGQLWLDLDLGVDSVTQAPALHRIATGIVVDNTDHATARQGSWWPTILRPGFYGNNYQIAYASSTERRFDWLPEVTRPGTYQVYAYWPQGPFARQATYQFSYQNAAQQAQQAQFVVNQRELGGAWYPLGTVELGMGTHLLSLTNQGADGTVAADAILLEWLGDPPAP